MKTYVGFLTTVHRKRSQVAAFFLRWTCERLTSGPEKRMATRGRRGKGTALQQVVSAKQNAADLVLQTNMLELQTNLVLDLFEKFGSSTISDPKKNHHTPKKIQKDQNDMN